MLIADGDAPTTMRQIKGDRPTTMALMEGDIPTTMVSLNDDTPTKMTSVKEIKVPVTYVATGLVVTLFLVIMVTSAVVIYIRKQRRKHNQTDETYDVLDDVAMKAGKKTAIFKNEKHKMLSH